MALEISVDCFLKIRDRAKDAAFQSPFGQSREETLDGAKPGGGSRGEVEGPARMPRQPSSHGGMLVGGVIVEDGVDAIATRSSSASSTRLSAKSPPERP